MQANGSFVNFCRLYLSKIRSFKRALVTRRKQAVEKCKNKDCVYGNLI